MIVGVGFDLVDIGRLERLLDDFRFTSARRWLDLAPTA